MSISEPLHEKTNNSGLSTRSDTRQDCKATETGWKHEIPDLERGDIVLPMGQNERR